MASKDSIEPQLDVEEAPMACSSQKRGGWITFPFILGSMMGQTLAMFGATSNIIVYLINQYNVKNIDAAQTSNIVNGCINLAPIAGAIASDSFLGCFAVVGASSLLTLLGMVLFTLTSTVSSLRPPPCPPGSATCAAASARQNAVLFLAVALASMGTGGTRFVMATMGANQLDTPRDRNVFFNWYFFVMYVAAVIGFTAVVYVQDNVGWGWGFGSCAAASAVGAVVLLLGVSRYRRDVPQGSPFVGLARVVVAAVRKWKVTPPPPPPPPPSRDEVVEHYYYSCSSGGEMPKRQVPTGRLRFFNRAAVKTPGDTHPDGSVAKPWRLCTVDQVEDLKAVAGVLPLWSSSLFLSISIAVVLSLSVLQALTLDRRLSPHFAVPAGSLPVATLASSALSLSLLDRCLYPSWRRLLGRAPTPLQRVGAGHALNAAALAAAALVERRRLDVVRSRGVAASATVPMSVLWLLPPLAVVGLGEAFHFPGQVVLYYQEFPEALRGSATGMVGAVVAVGFYASTAVVGLVRRSTGWLPEDINVGRLDMVYWMLAAVGTVNFGFYLLCATVYEYADKVENSNSSNTTTSSTAITNNKGEPSSAMDG